MSYSLKWLNEITSSSWLELGFLAVNKLTTGDTHGYKTEILGNNLS